VGDAITISSQAGVGAKATTTTQTIGVALEPYDGTGTSTIQVFIKPELTFASADQAALGAILTLASNTATNTPAQSAPIDAFMRSILTRMTGWLADAGNGIANIFAQTITATTVNAETVNTKKLCIEDVCVTKTELQNLLNGQGSGGPGGGGGSGGADTEPPTITLNGNNPAHINVGDSYTDLGATVSDNVDQNLGYKIFVNGSEVQSVTLDTSTPATYAIDYSAVDASGNAATSTRTVDVVVVP